MTLIAEDTMPEPDGTTWALCDDSGLCELVELSAVAPVDRVISTGADWLLLIDISPIRVGHLLLTPRLHQTRTTDLGRKDFVDHYGRVDKLIGALSAANSEQIVAVEHGTSSSYAGVTCVRHVHTHLCPIGEVEGEAAVIRSMADLITDSRTFNDWPAVFDVARTMDSYLIVRFKGLILLGKPLGGVRQVSRRVISAITETLDEPVDWIIGAEGANFRQTMRSIEELKLVVSHI